jgi:hypothetical protein
MRASDGSSAGRLRRPFDAIVRAYIGKIRPRAQAELDWFASQPSLQSAIRSAVLAVNSRGKRYSHQRRLTRAALEDAYAALSERAKRIGEAVISTNSSTSSAQPWTTFRGLARCLSTTQRCASARN